MSSIEPEAPARPSTARAGRVPWANFREVLIRPALTVAAIVITTWQLWTRPLVAPPLAITVFVLVALLAVSTIWPGLRLSARTRLQLLVAYAVLAAVLFPLTQATSMASLFAFLASATAGFTLASRQAAFAIAGTCALVASAGTALVTDLA
ncbi:MAG TPA: hypothetical protein VGM75_33435, partial [Pseudonocardiaceae bacterium]